MSTFEERAKAFEDKYKHDQDLLFRVMSKRAKLLGLWAAERMGRAGSEAEAYAMELVQDDAAVPGYHDMLDKIHTDLEAHGQGLSKHRIEKEMDRLLDLARVQVITA
ncbi:MAG: DUF1476 family protein [Azospirillum sp.]|nr:DUF1476 family protein [Azospirillum sp.]